MSRPAISLLLTRPAPASRDAPRGVRCFVARRSAAALVQPGYAAFLSGPLDHEDAPALSDATLQRRPGAAVAARRMATARVLFAATGWLPLVTAADAPAAPTLARWRRTWQAERWPFSQLLARMGVSPAALASPAALGAATTPAFGGPRFCTHVLALDAACAPEAFGELVGWHDGEWLSPADAVAKWRAGWPLAPMEAALLQALAGAEGKAEPGARSAAESHPIVRAQAAGARVLEGADEAPVPRAWQQVPHVELLPVRSPTLAPATHTNCYLLGGSDLIVVDPGTPYPDEQPILCAWLDARLAAGARLREAWITHHHADHIGAATLMRERYGARVRAHRHTAAALQSKVAIDALIEDDEVLPVGTTGYRALFTPGHATGHLCFYDLAHHHLFSGDNVLGLGTSIVTPQPHGNMHEYMHSLRRLLALPLGMLFPGHGPPAARSLARVQETLRQREIREQQVLAMLPAGDGWVGFERVLAQLYRGLPARTRQLAALSLRAHVDKLVAEGAVRLRVERPGAGEQNVLLARGLRD